MVTKETLVEDILSQFDVMTYFIKNGVSPFSCAGTFPQSLEKLLEIKKVKDTDAFIEGLNKYIAEHQLDNTQG